MARSRGAAPTERPSGCAGVEPPTAVHARPAGTRRGDSPRRRRLLPVAASVRAGVQRSAPEPGVGHGHHRHDPVARDRSGSRPSRRATRHSPSTQASAAAIRASGGWLRRRASRRPKVLSHRVPVPLSLCRRSVYPLHDKHSLSISTEGRSARKHCSWTDYTRRAI